TGNSTGKPPACQTPRFTCSASSRKWALHGVSSDHVLQMPITGRPSNTSPGNPWLRIQLRCPNPSLSILPNHAAERYLPLVSPLISLLGLNSDHTLAGRLHGASRKGPRQRGGRADGLLDAESLVPLGHPLRSRERSYLQLTCP